MKKRSFLFFLVGAALAVMPVVAHASFVNESITASPSDMVFIGGGNWTGGAVGVNGGSSPDNTGAAATAANVGLMFNIGSTISSLNSDYGAGNWSISDATLGFETTGGMVNNSRFGLGNGTFSILWAANSTWVAGTTDPPYATSIAALTSWAGGSSSIADLGDETFTIGSNKSTFNVSYGLNSNSLFVNDILSATTTNNANLTLYVMGTSSSLGMLMYSGGGSSLPTLSFEVNTASPTPVPPAFLLLGSGLAGLGFIKRRFCRV